MMAPNSLSLDPARRFRRAQRHDADDERQLVGDAVLGQPRHVAAHHAGIHAELRLHELRAGGDLGGERCRLPAGRRIDRIVGGAEEEGRARPRPCARTAIRRRRASGARCPAAGADRDRTPAWRRAGRRRSDRRRAASADCARRRRRRRCRSLCSAMRLRSRQVSCRIGSMPGLDQHGGRRHRAEMRPRAGAVGDVDGVGQALERRRLGQQFAARRRRPAASLPR